MAYKSTLGAVLGEVPKAMAIKTFSLTSGRPLPVASPTESIALWPAPIASTAEASPVASHAPVASPEVKPTGSSSLCEFNLESPVLELGAVQSTLMDALEAEKGEWKACSTRQ